MTRNNNYFLGENSRKGSTILRSFSATRTGRVRERDRETSWGAKKDSFEQKGSPPLRKLRASQKKKRGKGGDFG